MKDASPATENRRAAHPGAVPLGLGPLLAPAAWIAQTNVAQTIAAQGCYAHERMGASAVPFAGAAAER